MRPDVINTSQGDFALHIFRTNTLNSIAASRLPSGKVMSAISPSPLSGANPSTSPQQQRTWSPNGLTRADLTYDDLAAIDLGASSSKPGLLDLLPDLVGRLAKGVPRGVARRWQRECRRRRVGRAYDMALEIARVLPRGSQVLDVGCGNGFIAHHLSGMLGSSVAGIDLSEKTEALIDYRQFDGNLFPVRDKSLDALLFCYVLHHAQDVDAILSEVRRTLRDGGRVVVYEDIPRNGWDQIVCAIHNRKWRGRTGPCTFRGEREWCNTFASKGFEICKTRPLSRWRKVVHPVSRRLYVLRLKSAGLR